MRRERSAKPAGLGLLVALAFLLCGTASATHETLPSCRPEGWGLLQRATVGTGQPQTALLTAGWVGGMEGRRRCALRTTVQMHVVDGNGAVVVTGEWHVNTVLKPWDFAMHTWSWQNWCPGDNAGEPRVEFTDSSGESASQLIRHVPACIDPNAASTVTSLGDGREYVPRPASPIRRRLTRNEPPPLHEELIRVTNGWVVSDGYTLVAVYAGRPGRNRAVGRFALVRQNLVFGVQYEPPDVVNVGKTGPVKITSTPHGDTTTSQRGRIGFVAKDGTRGLLDLYDDRVRITARG